MIGSATRTLASIPSSSSLRSSQNSRGGAVTHFKPVSTGIFKEDGVVTSIVGHRPFEIACSGMFGHLC